MINLNNTLRTGLMGLAAIPGLAFGGEEWTAFDGLSYHWFGYSVATADGWRLSGAPLENRVGAQMGAAYLLDTTVPGGFETKIMPLVRNTGQRFGWALDITGDTMVIGAPGSGSMIGEAYVYERTGETWTQVAILTGLPGHGGDAFGSAVAVVGDRILVGAPKDNTLGSQAGAVYAFQKGVSTWVLEDTLHGPHTSPGDQFGFALDVDGDRVVVGAFSANIQVFNEGAAYVFEHGKTGYSFQQELWSKAPRPNSQFARSVSILGDRIAVGATEDHQLDVRSGSVSIYGFTGNQWSFDDRIESPTGEIGNAFGYSVGVKPEGLIVGAPLATVAGVRSGDAYVFHPLGSQWGAPETLAPTSPAQEGDYFGISVAIGSDGAVVGAMRNGTKAYQGGAAHLFDEEAYDVPLIVSYCSCDTGGSCGSAPQAHGCENSAGKSARLTANGTTSVKADDLILQVDGLPRKANVWFVMGEPEAPMKFYDGLMCFSSASGTYAWIDSTRASKQGVAYSDSSLLRVAENEGLTAIAGKTYAFQAAYYDRNGPCGTRYNSSDALLVTLVP